MLTKYKLEACGNCDLLLDPTRADCPRCQFGGWVEYSDSRCTEYEPAPTKLISSPFCSEVPELYRELEKETNHDTL